MKLAKHFRLEEFTYSKTAEELNIENIPGEQEINNLRILSITILEPIREVYGQPMIISSGYRTKLLNEALNGAENSQHLYGEAADIRQKTKEENKRLFNIICEMIKRKEIVVGQLINEKNYSWIHISLPGKHINQILNIN
jgi:hypothetical protein